MLKTAVSSLFQRENDVKTTYLAAPPRKASDDTYRMLVKMVNALALVEEETDYVRLSTTSMRKSSITNVKCSVRKRQPLTLRAETEVEIPEEAQVETRAVRIAARHPTRHFDKTQFRRFKSSNKMHGLNLLFPN